MSGRMSDPQQLDAAPGCISAVLIAAYSSCRRHQKDLRCWNARRWLPGREERGEADGCRDLPGARPPNRSAHAFWWSSTLPLWHDDAVGGRPPHHWKTSTFVAGLRVAGLTAPLVIDGAMNGVTFLAYVE